MANWIKWKYGFATSPAVIDIAERLGIDERLAAACLMDLLAWFDTRARSYELEMHGISLESIDRIVRLPQGFSAAVVANGLLKLTRKKLIAIDRTWSGSGQAARKKTQFVYFIRSTRTGCIKIGFSFDPNQRIRELSTSEPVELLGYITGGTDAERRLHDRFSADRVHGEWFTPSESLIAYLREKGFYP